MRRYLKALACVALMAVPLSAPLSAELKMTSRMSARQVPGAPAGNDMMAAMIGPMLQQMFGGADGVEMTVILNEDGRMRTEYGGAFSGMPAGAVVILKADGSSVGFDAKAQTWWQIPQPGPEVAQAMAEMKPEVSTSRSGQFENIAGLKAEKVSILMRMPVPLPPGAEQAPPELLAMLPTEIRVDIDTWQTDTHAKYSKGMLRALATGPLASMNFDKLMAEMTGLPLRQVVRMSVMPGYEIETVTSKVSEEDLSDSLFDVPAGFKEIAMPTPNIR